MSAIVSWAVRLGHCGANEQNPSELAHDPLTQYPQSQSPSVLHASAVQPWLAGALGVVHRVLVAQVHPASQGIGWHPCASAFAPPTAHRSVAPQVNPWVQSSATQMPPSGWQR
jgi:hypothetical protein